MSLILGQGFTIMSIHILLTFIGFAGLLVSIATLLDMRDMPRNEPNVGGEE